VVKATEDVQRLWKRYKRNRDAASRDALILMYLPLVKYISDRIFSRLPKRVDVRDLRSAGIYGLIRAIEAFDLERGIKFETYCSVRVRGSILDELRAQDWVPRPVRNRTQRLKEAEAELRRDLGRNATDLELAEKLGVGPDELRSLGRESASTNLVSLSADTEGGNGDSEFHRIDLLANGEESDPVELLQRADIAELIHKNLDDKEQQILLLYYYEDLTMREIGSFLRLSESRVCQLHSRIMERLKEALAEQETELLV
jgi:RNA polymerase sigma factor for flagellar operon FliA